jgi:tRNA (cmo5U34)-methyltransferase
VEEIRSRFDNDVERFSNLETGQQTTIDAPLSLELITEAARYVNPNATSVLDIGCGAGNFTLKMLNKIPHLNCSLIDLSEPMLDKAKERVSETTNGSISCFQSDIRDIKLDINSFDIVLAGAVLHHLRTEHEWEFVFSKIYNALKPGGSFWIADLIAHESPWITAMFWDRYGDYLKSLGGDDFKEKVLAYVEKEDSPVSLNFQLKMMEKVGFKYTEVLHKNSCFAAFGGVK